MHLLSFDRSATAQTAAVTLLTAGALTLLALTGAHWTWQWLAPQAESRGQPVISGTDQTSAQATAARSLFGNAAGDHGSSSPTGTAVKLLGIVAATAGGRGYAVLRIDPRQILTVGNGEEIVPGLRLAEVGVDHVILERGGVRESLGWPTKSATAEPLVLRIGK